MLVKNLTIIVKHSLTIFRQHILYIKSASCLIFSYGKMYEYLAWKRQASLNSFDNGFYEFMVLFENTSFILTCII